MNNNIIKLKDKVKQSVKGLTGTEAFNNWFKNQKVQEDDLVLLNNSFIYRKPTIQTSKNEQYLCLKVRNGSVSTSEVSVARLGDFNVDFKLFSSKSKNLPEIEALDDALKKELSNIGQLVFVLIGELKDVEHEVFVNHSSVKCLRYDPKAEGSAVQDSNDGTKIIIVNQLTDPANAWRGLEGVLRKEVGNNLSSVESAFADAFEKLRDGTRKHLIMPQVGIRKSRGCVTLLSQFRSSVSKQRQLYARALEEYDKGGTQADAYLRDAMRIAYNFADDAIKVLELLVSIADLKALLLWCTIKEHFDIAEAFRNLPWIKSKKKASLERYREIISGARNRAFHNLLAFDRTIEANLQGIQISARRLTLFPAYGRRKTSIPFDYEDREMVEVLAKLTRAPETTIDFDFWKKNEKVMECFENLLHATEEALWLLNTERSR